MGHHVHNKRWVDGGPWEDDSPPPPGFLAAVEAMRENDRRRRAFEDALIKRMLGE